MDAINKLVGAIINHTSEQNAVWAISWPGARFDKRTKKHVKCVEMFEVVGTQQASVAAQRVVDGLSVQHGFTDAHEMVQMKRAGYLT